jgi:hypothetical protein
MIDYHFDPTTPFTVLQSDDTHAIVNGTSKVIQTTDGEFGGVVGTWRVPKVKLLSKDQKRALRWKKRVMGTKSANDEFDRLCEIVIATHTTKQIL